MSHWFNKYVLRNWSTHEVTDCIGLIASKLEEKYSLVLRGDCRLPTRATVAAGSGDARPRHVPVVGLQRHRLIKQHRVLLPETMLRVHPANSCFFLWAKFREGFLCHFRTHAMNKCFACIGTRTSNSICSLHFTGSYIQNIITDI